MVRDVLETVCSLSWPWGLPTCIKTLKMLRNSEVKKTVQAYLTQYFPNFAIAPLLPYLLTSHSTLEYLDTVWEMLDLVICKVLSEFMIL